MRIPLRAALITISLANSMPVARSRMRSYASLVKARSQLRSVAAPVVGDDDLGGVPARLDRFVRFGDAGGERLDLVEAGHHDRYLDRRPCVIAPPGWTLRDLHCARG